VVGDGGLHHVVGDGGLHHVVGDGPHGVQEERLPLRLHYQNLHMHLQKERINFRYSSIKSQDINYVN
jgi:hypothetical protein